VRREQGIHDRAPHGPAEHLALPNENDVREGVRVARLAVRIGDIAKYPDRRETEKMAALTRREMQWHDHMKYLMFPEQAWAIRESRKPAREETCTMCGKLCAMKKGMEIFAHDITGDKLLPRPGPECTEQETATS